MAIYGGILLENHIFHSIINECDNNIIAIIEADNGKEPLIKRIVGSIKKVFVRFFEWAKKKLGELKKKISEFINKRKNNTSNSVTNSKSPSSNSNINNSTKSNESDILNGLKYIYSESVDRAETELDSVTDYISEIKNYTLIKQLKPIYDTLKRLIIEVKNGKVNGVEKDGKFNISFKGENEGQKEAFQRLLNGEDLSPSMSDAPMADFAEDFTEIVDSFKNSKQTIEVSSNENDINEALVKLSKQNSKTDIIINVLNKIYSDIETSLNNYKKEVEEFLKFGENCGNLTFDKNDSQYQVKKVITNAVSQFSKCISLDIKYFAIVVSQISIFTAESISLRKQNKTYFDKLKKASDYLLNK